MDAMVVLQASPEFKGIKTDHGLVIAHDGRFKPALNSKGLRREHSGEVFGQLHGFKPALNSKGLRRARRHAAARLRLQASPEFKGIKTAYHPRQVVAAPGFKPALNSKGLRPDRAANVTIDSSLQASPEFKGIKTDGSVTRSVLTLQASPEFKGIKTLVQPLVQPLVQASSQP